MEARKGSWSAWLVALSLAPGCSSSGEMRAGTEAEDVVRGYYEALCRRDWIAAYAMLAFLVSLGILARPLIWSTLFWPLHVASDSTP